MTYEPVERQMVCNTVYFKGSIARFCSGRMNAPAGPILAKPKPKPVVVVVDPRAVTTRRITLDDEE